MSDICGKYLRLLECANAYTVEIEIQSARLVHSTI